MAAQPKLNQNWLLTDHGDLINLDFLSKVSWGGNWSVLPNPLIVMLSHGVSAGKGATTTYTYADSDTAQAAYNNILAAMKSLGIIRDLNMVNV